MANVDIRPLKEFAWKHLADYPISQQTILSERDMLSVEEFVAKVDTWLKLLKREANRNEIVKAL